MSVSTRAAVVAIFATFLVSCQRSNLPPASSLIEFCRVPIREVLRRGNATFQVEYAFVVSDGRPTNLRTIDNPLKIDSGVGELCLQRWRLGFVPTGTEMRVRFHWRHAFGWDWVELAWGQNKLLIPLTGEDPYLMDAIGR